MADSRAPGRTSATSGQRAQTQTAKHLAAEAPYQVIPSNRTCRSAPGRVLSDLMLPMRDDVRLATDVYLPEGDGPFEAILTRMPYGKTEAYCFMPVIARFWVGMGYAAVVQDVRGKFGSEGYFEANLKGNEMADAYDTLDWICQQPWSNGKIGMWGESYYGFTSYAAATTCHPALRCVAPGDISLDRYQTSYRAGCLQLNTVGTWAMSMNDQTYQDLSQLDYWHLPLADMARAAGGASDLFDGVIANAVPSEFWDKRSLHEGYEKIRIPVLHWGGWYDNYLGPTIADWRRMQANNAEADHQHLFIGPWDHEGTSDTLQRVGLLAVAKGVAEERWDTFVSFFDRYLMGVENAFGVEGRVRYYVMGADEWRCADEWPPPETKLVRYYLHSAGNANTLNGDGSLDCTAPSDESGDDAADSFDYDPRDPVADTLALDCWAIAGEMGDRRAVEQREDVLVYTTAPLAADLEVTGALTAHLYVVSSAVDTDFAVALVDVFEDGRANLIQDGILRASYRDGAKAPVPLEPGRTYALEIDMWSTSYVLRAGHRLRVEVTSSCFNRYDRNLNTGEPMGQGALPQVAHQTLLHDATCPSHILLPVRSG